MTTCLASKNHSRAVTGVVAWAAALAAGWAEGPAWTGWRGESRDARVEEFRVPHQWPEALEAGWKVEVGTGYASPLVVGDRLYQHAREGDDEVLWCLALADGKPLWRKSLPVAFEPGRGGERHGRGPKSTPTTADGRVFTLSITGTLAAWDARDGDLLWKRDFRDRFEDPHPYWGTATSPVVEHGKLYVHTGSCEKGALFCLDPATGKNLWVQDSHAHCYSSPLVLTLQGQRQLVEFNHAGLSGIDLETGKILWLHRFGHRGNKQNTPTPVHHKGILVVGGEDRGIFAVRPRHDDGTWSVAPLWSHRQVSLDMSSPVVHDGLVYGFSHLKLGQFFCLDPASGTVLWTGEPRAGDNAQFLSVPGHVLALTDDGLLRVLRAAGKETAVLREYRVAEDQTWTAPVLVGDSLFIKDRTGLARWRFSGR